jgi:hypothetical protein
MKRFLRHLFTFCSAVSLLLWLVLCVLWVRSYFRVERINFTVDENGMRQTTSLLVTRGFIIVQHVRQGRLTAWPPEGFEFEKLGSPRPPSAFRDDRPPRQFGWAGFDLRYYRGEAYWGRSSLYVTVPIWFGAACAGSLPTFRTIHSLRRRYRQVSGRCLKCGYDLRASPERCPECGTPVEV